ncbi:ATP-binding protein [Kangiella aquimarina]|uniref:ATP-binding protein n=1 Tax=Kangiella aquimarina TaxID=261965 RepID=A0ABZ0X213_9GAMM|nr:ATP-binding protein [Kangiella aquimarina]WQG84434.1 ATP-binding protein [Kangiella aquimarina]
MTNDASITEHPLKHPELLQIHTLEIEALLQFCSSIIGLSLPGALIAGYCRSGKSTGTKKITPYLKDNEGKSIPSEIIYIPSRDRKTNRGAWRQLAYNYDFPLKRSATSDDISRHYITYLLDRCYEAKSTRIVLMVDEAQRLSINQFAIYAEIFDRLKDSFGISCHVFFVANLDNFKDTYRLLQQREDMHIYERFFKRVFFYKPITSHDSVRHILRQYDFLTYPPSSNISYAQYFLSEQNKDYESLRLEDYSTLIWQVFFEKFKTPYKLKYWSTESFFCFVNLLISQYIPQIGIDDISDELIEHCIHQSGLVVEEVNLEGL